MTEPETDQDGVQRTADTLKRLGYKPDVTEWVRASYPKCKVWPQHVPGACTCGEHPKP